MQHLGKSICSGAFQLDAEPVSGLNTAALESDQKAVGLPGLEVAKRKGFAMGHVDRPRPRSGGRNRLLTARTSLDTTFGLKHGETCADGRDRA